MKRRVGDRRACARCGADIEWHGRAAGWVDRGGNTRCADSGMVGTYPPAAVHRPESEHP